MMDAGFVPTEKLYLPFRIVDETGGVLHAPAAVSANCEGVRS
jgi:hypothetical protein